MADRVTLKHLRAFVAVAETGSFTLGAARLCVTQSALTAVIQQFEAAVAQKMFDRSTRRVDLTRQAEQFLPEAQRVLRAFDNAVGDLMDLSSGLLMASLWIAVREPKRGLRPLWWLALLLLGNMATLAFVLRCSLGAGSVREVFTGRRAAET